MFVVAGLEARFKEIWQQLVQISHDPLYWRFTREDKAAIKEATEKARHVESSHMAVMRAIKTANEDEKPIRMKKLEASRNAFSNFIARWSDTGNDLLVKLSATQVWKA